LSKNKKLKKLEDGRVLQWDLSCADKVKNISESIEFHLFQSLMKENLSFWVTFKNPPFKARKILIICVTRLFPHFSKAASACFDVV